MAGPGALWLCAGLNPGVYTRVKGRCSQTPPPSPSSQSPRVAVRAPGDSGGELTQALRGWRGHQSERYPEHPLTRIQHRGTRHTAVDMLSPGDMPSSTGCSVDCGLEAERFIVGGCGGGRVGLCRGLGVGRDLVKVLVKLEGEARGGAAAAGESWPEAKEYP